MKSYPKAVVDHKELVLRCLSDDDVTIRMKVRGKTCITHGVPTNDDVCLVVVTRTGVGVADRNGNQEESDRTST